MLCSSAAPDRRWRRVVGAGALALLLRGGAAWAEDPPAPESAEPAPAAPPPKPAPPPAAAPAGGEEIVVFGDIQVATARRKLDRELRALGYKPGERKDDRTVYRPESSWKPSVIVYDDGFTVLRRSPPRFEPWVQGKTRLVWLSCIPPFTLMCIKVSGWLVTNARLDPQKERVATALQPEVRGWREAIIARNMKERINTDLPTALDALWLEGAPIEPDRPPLPTPVERRAAILQFWAERACTPEGQAVRDLVEVFVAMEVQRSDWPAPSAELRAAEAAQACGDKLEGPGLSDLDGGAPAP
jgi:hypothetical protein